LKSRLEKRQEGAIEAQQAVALVEILEPQVEGEFHAGRIIVQISGRL
jgi:hypothetical protein